MSNLSRKNIWDRATSRSLEHLDPTAARAILRVKLSKAATARVNRLSALANEDDLSPVERRELEYYLQLGNFITLMHSKARLALKRVHPPVR